jgi:sec-independent protein translocase protein TatB
MFNIGFVELIVLAVIALIVIGPKQLPEIARVVGRTLNEVKRATEELTGDFIRSAKSANIDVKKATADLLEKANVDFSETEYKETVLKESPTNSKNLFPMSGDSKHPTQQMANVESDTQAGEPKEVKLPTGSSTPGEDGKS